MKNERDKREYMGQHLRLDELTSNPISSNLEREGEIFMPEPGNGEIPVNNEEQNNRPQENPVTDDVKRVAKENWERMFPEETHGVGPARTFIDGAIEKGISPNVDTSPNFTPRPLTEDDLNRLKAYRDLIKVKHFDKLPHDLKVMLMDGGLTRDEMEELRGNPQRLAQAIGGIVGPEEHSDLEPEDDGGIGGSGGNGDGGEPPEDNDNGNGEEGGDGEESDGSFVDDADEETRTLHDQNEEAAKQILEEFKGFRKEWRKANKLREIIDQREASGIDETPEERLKAAADESGKGADTEKPQEEEEVSRFQKEFGEGIERIRGARSFDEIAGAEGPLDNFLYYAEATEKASKLKFDKEYKPVIERLKKLRDARDLDGIKQIMNTAFPQEIRNHFITVESILPDIPYSLEDLAAYIMRSEGEIWRTGHKRELLDAEGRVNRVNFLAWVRKRMIEVHEFSPTQTVDFFSQIYVKSRWSQISLQEMVLTGSYFTEKRKEPILIPSPEDPKKFTVKKDEVTYHQNKDYERLRQQLLTEAFLFNTSRNSHVEYVNVQPSEEKLLETLQRIYQSNVFTRSNFLEFIMSMPSSGTMTTEERKRLVDNENERRAKLKNLTKKEKERILAEELNRRRGVPMSKEERQQFLSAMSKPMTEEEAKRFLEEEEMKLRIEDSAEVGQAARQLLLAYYYIYDFDTLKTILGENSALFAPEYVKRDESGEIEKDEKGEPKMERFRGVKGPGDPFDAYGENPWFDANGRLKLKNGRPPADFMRYVNVFTGPGPNKDEVVVNDVRQRMVESIMNKLGISYEDAKYAEAWAFSMTKWTGLAAKNDTGGVGFDAWTKVLCTFEYRLRQMSPTRNAAYGNIFNVLGLKRLGLNFFEGIMDTEGRTVLEAIQGGEGSDFRNLDISLRELHKQEKEKEALKRKLINETRRIENETIRRENEARRREGKELKPEKGYLDEEAPSMEIRFQQQIMGNFVANHVASGFHLFSYLIDNNQLNIQDFVRYENGREVIDYEKANKALDGLRKWVRDWLATWSGANYSKTIHTWETRVDDDGKARPTPVNIPVFADLFGRDVVEKAKMRYERLDRDKTAKMTSEEKKEYEKDIQEHARTWTIAGITDSEGEIEVDFSRLQRSIRETLWKDVFQYFIEAEIESHRNVYSDQPRFNAALINKWYDFLKMRGFYTDEEIAIMRENTSSTELSMALEEGGSALLFGGLQGMFKKILENLKEVTKAA